MQPRDACASASARDYRSCDGSETSGPGSGPLWTSGFTGKGLT